MANCNLGIKCVAKHVPKKQNQINQLKARVAVSTYFIIYYGSRRGEQSEW